MKFREKLVYAREEESFRLVSKIEYAHISPFIIKSISFFGHGRNVLLIKHKGIPIVIARGCRDFKAISILNGLAELTVHQLEGQSIPSITIEVETDLTLALAL